MKHNTILPIISIQILLLQMYVTHPAPKPSPWPEQFHAKLYSNLTKAGYQQVTDMWYDWPKGRNTYMMQRQLRPLLREVEWNNGTSFFFTFGPDTCDVIDFGVGITRPDFLEDGHYVGTRIADGGFLCNVWEKVDFILYYEDVTTKRPVKWDFLDGSGITTHVITFEVGAVLNDSLTRAPAFCFNQESGRVE